MHNARPTTPEQIAEFVEELLERNRARFGGFVMEDDSDDDSDDSADSDEDQSEEDAENDSTDDSNEDAEDDSDDGGGSEVLGDKGKQALERMKAKLKNERARRREAESKLSGKDGDNADTEALQRANDRIRKAEVKAAAKGVLADPSDAYKFLDLDQFEVDDDGNVDEDEIADAIEDLIKNKPYLAAQGGRRFKGGAGGGARKESRPKQLTRADLKGMSPQEIDKAHKEGRLADLLQSKQ